MPQAQKYPPPVVEQHVPPFWQVVESQPVDKPWESVLKKKNVIKRDSTNQCFNFGIIWEFNVIKGLFFMWSHVRNKSSIALNLRELNILDSIDVYEKSRDITNVKKMLPDMTQCQMSFIYIKESQCRQKYKDPANIVLKID